MPRLSGGNLIDKAPLPKSSSQRTPRWRELDSNLPFRARAGSILPVRFVAEPNPRKRSVKTIAANHWAIYCRRTCYGMAKTSDRIAHFHKGEDFSHALDPQRPFGHPELLFDRLSQSTQI